MRMKNDIKPNAMKIDFKEDEFIISFAEIEGEDHPTVEKEAQLSFLPKQMLSVINPMIKSVIDYQEKFGIDLGINKKEW